MEPVTAVHRAREDALLDTLSAARDEAERRAKAASAAARPAIVGLCEATPALPQLACTTEERRWLDGALTARGSPFLADPAEMDHRDLVAAEDHGEAVDATAAIERRFASLPRFDRKETYALKPLMAPLVYGRPALPPTDCGEGARNDLHAATQKLWDALVLLEDGGKVADVFLRRAIDLVHGYYRTFGDVNWAEPNMNDERLGHWIASVFDDAYCRPKSWRRDPRTILPPPSTPTARRVEPLCAPWAALKHEMRARTRDLASRRAATSARRAARVPWADAAGRVAAAAADPAVVAGYGVARAAERAAAASAVAGGARGLEADARFVPENGTDFYGALGTAGALASDAFRAVAQALAMDARARTLATLDAAVAEKNETAARVSALEEDMRGYVLARPSEAALHDYRDAEAALHRARADADASRAALADALAAAAARDAAGPPPSRGDADRLRGERDENALAAEAAAATLASFGPGAAASAAAVGDAAASLAAALEGRGDGPSAFAARAATKLAAALGAAGAPARTCAADAADAAGPRKRSGSVARAVAAAAASSVGTNRREDGRPGIYLRTPPSRPNRTRFP